MSKFARLWYWQSKQLDSKWWEIHSFETEEHPFPSLVTGPDRPSESAPFSQTKLDPNGRLVVVLTHEHLPDAPDMVFVHVENLTGHLANQSLVGFESVNIPDGTIITLAEAKRIGLNPSDRVAAINWGYPDPKLLQLYVSPDYRRRRIGTKMINVCDIVEVAQGRGGFIYGGDQVTELGKTYGEAWAGSSRIRPPEIMMPDMD